MMYTLDLVSKLFIAVKKQKWEKARELTEEIRRVLETYKNAC